MWGHGAWDWVIVGAAYVIGIGFFRILGGFAAASQAIQRWGDASARRRIRRVAPEYAHLVERPPVPPRD